MDGTRSFLLNGLMQTDLDANHFRIINLDTSNLPPSGIPPTIIPPPHQWLQTWNSTTRTWTAAQPAFEDLPDTLTGPQQQHINEVGILRSGIWQASPIQGTYLDTLNNIRSPVADVSMANFKIINLADPVSNLDAVNFRTVQLLAAGDFQPKAAVAAATIGLVLLVGLTPIDGYTPVSGDRILVKNQHGREWDNGIYIASAGDWTRSSDMTISTQFTLAICLVTGGNTQAGEQWVQINTNPDLTDTGSGNYPNFVEFSAAQNLIAGNGINISGNVISAVGTAARIAVGAAIDIDPGYVGQASLNTLGTITTGTWNGSLIPGQYGGTGFNNSGKTINIAGNLTVSLGLNAPASSPLTFSILGTTFLTLPMSGQLATLAQPETFSSKRIIPRTGTVASSPAPSINTDATDVFSVTALSTNITSMTTGLSGTPVEGQTLLIWFKDNGLARSITWGSAFRASTDLPLPVTTTTGWFLYNWFVFNATFNQWVLSRTLNHI